MRNRNWVKYKNGNYTVFFNRENGTKIRKTDSNEFIPEFPENCDLLISTKCNKECKFCYANCSKDGKFGDILNAKFIDTLHPYTELAMNINDPIHPDLKEFLIKIKNKDVIANATINQEHLVKHKDFIEELFSENLLHGLGISYSKQDNFLIDFCKAHPNSVIHVINGIFNKESYEYLRDNNLKMLILGYKDHGRGESYRESIENKEIIDKNKQWLYDSLEDVIESFSVVSFDNLALEQLNVRRILTDDEWESFYMGDDGSVTFAIDLVSNTFSKNSMSDDNIPINNLSIDEMFNLVQAVI